jgi:hypothetical protein
MTTLVRRLLKGLRSRWNALLAWTGRGSGEDDRVFVPRPSRGTGYTRLMSRILLIVHDPLLESQDRRLRESQDWRDPTVLCDEFIEDLSVCSHGRVRFQIEDRILVDEFPRKEDGFRYSPKGFVHSLRTGQGFHQPDRLDYPRLIEQFGILERVKRGEIDEIWMFGFPYAGYYESAMGGPGAYWCNAPPLEGTFAAGRRFVMMGFNYERGVGEMLESYGHRVESILGRVFSGTHGESNLWEQFIRHHASHPGRAQVGTMHFAPNSERDYDWGNRRFVPSGCDDWLSFPPLTGTMRSVNCEEWGGGDIREHHKWWFAHLPYAEGGSNGISFNWWKYAVDPNRA